MSLNHGAQLRDLCLSESRAMIHAAARFSWLECGNPILSRNEPSFTGGAPLSTYFSPCHPGPCITLKVLAFAYSGDAKVDGSRLSARIQVPPRPPVFTADQAEFAARRYVTISAEMVGTEDLVNMQAGAR